MQVLETLSQLSGLPVSILDTKEQLDLKSVRDFFARAGDWARTRRSKRWSIASPCSRPGLTIRTSRSALFLFAGPTGTGKTELAKAVSEFLFGSAERMIRLDMSEFQMLESMSKILGQSSAAASTPTR